MTIDINALLVREDCIEQAGTEVPVEQVAVARLVQQIQCRRYILRNKVEDPNQG